MKSLMIVAAAAALSIAAPALAQTAPDLTHPSFYGSIGDSYLTPNYSGGIDEITGRVGARMGQAWGVNWGVEGEIGGGVSLYKQRAGGVSSYTTEPVAGAGYLVGYLPVSPMPQLEFLARVGYGASGFHQSFNGSSFSGVTNSVNFGAGAQYWLTGVDGVRADYTRRDYLGGSDIPKGADVWSVAYVRKF